MITLRRFAREDAEDVKQSFYPDMTVSEAADMIDEWNSGVFGGRRFDMFAIVSDGRIVGYVSLYERAGTTASVGAEVIPCERGNGAATEALALLTRYASEQGYLVLVDQVRADNKASIRLHEKLGFETDGYVCTNQRGHEVLLYVKAI